MTETNFTQKEMMIRMMDKLEIIDDKLGETNAMAKATNGKVRLHSKIIYGLCGALITFIGWILSCGIGV